MRFLSARCLTQTLRNWRPSGESTNATEKIGRASLIETLKISEIKRRRSHKSQSMTRPEFFSPKAKSPEAIDGVFTTPELFPLLGVSPAMGRAFTSGEDKVGAPRVVVISHNLWERRFNSDPEIIGKEIPLSTRPYTIIGVMPAGFRFPADTSRKEFIMPFAPVNADALARRGVHSFKSPRASSPKIQSSKLIRRDKHDSSQPRRAYPETNALNTAVVVLGCAKR